MTVNKKTDKNPAGLPSSKEFVVKGGDDSTLWCDIDSDADESWSNQIWKDMVAKAKEQPKPTTTKAATPQSLARSLVASRIDEAKRLAETVIKPSEEEDETAVTTKHYTGTAHDAHQEVHGGKNTMTVNRDLSKRDMQAIDIPKSDFVDYRKMGEYDDDYSSDTKIAQRLQEVDRYKRWKDGLSESEIGAIVRYTGGDYEKINNNLRDNGKHSDSRNSVENLDGAINKSSLDKDILLRRFVTGRESSGLYQQIASLKQGDIWTDPSYISTTVGSGYSGNIEFEIRAPRGTKGAFLGFNGLSEKVSEVEFLLPRNTNLYINSVTRKGNKLVVDATVLPQG